MKQILVVDDDMMNLVLIKDVLSLHYQVSSVTSGEKVIKRLEEEIPDLILMDIEMSGMDGREIAGIIKEDDRWKEIPIVFLTADSNPETEEKCLELGADDFIMKPFVPIVMKRRIGRILELNDLRKALETQLKEKKNQTEDVTETVITDPLTGLYGGSYLEGKISALVREGNKGTMFIMCMDNFKDVNDTLGHIAGENTLQMFAQTLKENTRKMDIVGRADEDKFVVFFMDMTDRTIARDKANTIINTFVEKFRETYDMREMSVSVRVAYCPENGNNFSALYENADKVL